MSRRPLQIRPEQPTRRLYKTATPTRYNRKNTKDLFSDFAKVS